MVLGGMRISCEIVRKAKEMGAFVAVTDYNPPHESPAKLIADESFMVSTTDIEGVLKLIRMGKFDGVLTGFVDLLLPYYAEICERAGLPSLATKEQYEIFIEKRKYKALLKKYGVPVPDEYVVDGLPEKKLSSIRYPVVVKPTDSSGARGIQICEGKAELELACAEALRFSKTGTVLIEQHLNGPEVTAFWFMQDGDPFFIGLANRHVENHQGNGVIPLPVGYTLPSVFTNRYIRDIVPNMKKMLRETGISNGLLFLQCIVDEGLPKVYDLGLRLTGSLEYYIFDQLCGFNPLEMIIRFALTGNEGKSIADKVDPFLKGNYGWNISFLMKPGVIAEIIGYEAIKKGAGVIDAVIAQDIGSEVKREDRGLLKQICCRVLGSSSTIDDMKEAVEKTASAYQVHDENGASLLLPVLDINKYEDTIM